MPDTRIVDLRQFLDSEAQLHGPQAGVAAVFDDAKRSIEAFQNQTSRREDAPLRAARHTSRA
jgi:hypothetical protein